MSITYNMPSDEYHAHPAIGSTSAKLMLRSRQLFRDAQTGLYQQKDTPALAIGRVAHMAVLEPERLATHVTTTGPINAKTSKPYGRDTVAFADWQAANPDVLVVDEWIPRALERMPAQVSDLFAEPGHAEVSVFHETQLGFGVKARPDRLTDANIILDLKTIDDVTKAERAIARWSYWFSEAWYRMVMSAATRKSYVFKWVFMEKNPPYRWRIVTPDASYRMYGDAMVERVLGELEECHRTGDWTDKDDVEEVISLPDYLEETDDDTEDDE